MMLNSVRRRLLGIIQCLLVMSMLLGQEGQIYGAQTIEIHGHYDSATYNAQSGKFDENLNVGFVATLSGNTWKICATNLNDRFLWEHLVYDGTNITWLTPYEGHFVHPRPETNLVFASVSSSPVYQTVVNSFLKIYAAWFTYGLAPQNVTLNKAGKIDMPLPWYMNRQQLFAYGYQWILTPSTAGKFVQECKVIRDTSLDLEEDQEFLRPDFVYPANLAEMERQRKVLEVRKEVPDGFVDTTYNCTKWYQTNNIVVPMASEVIRYKSQVNKPFSTPVFSIKLTATEVIIRDELDEAKADIPNAPTYVRDYRYKKNNETRRYEYAEYTLPKGEPWKPNNDPAILAEVENHLKHGRHYNDFGFWAAISNPTKKTKVTLACLVMVIVQLPLAIMLFNRNKKRKGKNT